MNIVEQKTEIVDQKLLDDFSRQFTAQFYEIAEKGQQAIRDKITSVEDYLNYLVDSGFAKESDWDAITKHHFAPAVYIREVCIEKDQLVVGKIHKYDHWNYILKGSVTVLTKDGAVRYEAPVHMLSTAGTKRLLYTHEETVWVVIHPNPTNTQDLDQIEEEHIAKDFSDFPLLKEE